MTNSQNGVDWDALRDSIEALPAEEREALRQPPANGVRLDSQGAVTGVTRFEPGLITLPYDTGIISHRDTGASLVASGGWCAPSETVHALREGAITRLARSIDVPRALLETDTYNTVDGPEPGPMPPLLSLGEIAVRLRELTEMVERHLR